MSDTTDILQPTAEVRTYVLGPEGSEVTLQQRPLSFFGKMELFAVLGGVLEKAIGEGGISLDDLLGAPGEKVDVANVQDADMFLKGIAKLVQFAPDLLKDVYCIALGVPRERREHVKYLLDHPDYGLTDDQGMEILETFIEQNWEAMVDFFKVRIMPLVSKVQDRVSPPSKPLKPTRQTTPKQ